MHLTKGFLCRIRDMDSTFVSRGEDYGYLTTGERESADLDDTNHTPCRTKEKRQREKRRQPWLHEPATRMHLHHCIYVDGLAWIWRIHHMGSL